MRVNGSAAYKPCEPALVSEKVSQLGRAYEQLVGLAAERRRRLEASRRLWQVLWELGEEAAWMREQEQILAGADCGRDLTSARHLLSEHEAFRDEMAARYGPLGNGIAAGEALVQVAMGTHSEKGNSGHDCDEPMGI